MLRVLAVLILIIGITLAGIPNGPVSHFVPQSQSHFYSPSMSPGDPNGTLTAFNYTNAQADLFTNSSIGLKTKNIYINPPPSVYPYNFTRFRWLSTVPRTSNGTMIAGTGFQLNLTKNSLPSGQGQTVSWNMTIPKSTCGGCKTVSVDFNFFGNLTRGTNANYTVSLPNRTIISGPQGSGIFNTPGVFPAGFGGPFSVSGCPELFCVDVTRYIGYNLTLTFGVGWNSTETGMSVDAGEIEVASIDSTLKTSTSNYMTLNPLGTVTHLADTPAISFNNTIRYKNVANVYVNHTWAMDIFNLFYPAGYSISRVQLNGTSLLKPVGVPFENTACITVSTCTTSIVAFNLTDIWPTGGHATALVVNATSPNTISSLTTLVSGASVNIFEPSDSFQANVTSHPSVVNMTFAAKSGQLNITLVDPSGSSLTVPFRQITTSSGGNITFSLPTGHLGLWRISAVFTSNFDLGSKSGTFTVEQIQVVPGSFGSGGSNSLLNVQGKLYYNASLTTPAANVNGVVFAVDSGAQNSNLITTTNSSTTGLYISNVTLVNGVFTQGQPLIMLFTVVNPTSTQAFPSANVTIEHEWSTLQTHGVKVTIPLTMGDQPFILGPIVYRADITFAANGVQVTVTSLARGNFRTGTMSIGASPVAPTRPHTGLFKIAITSATTSPVNTYRNSLESAPYAYVVGLPFLPARYLAYSKAFTTDSTGSFATTLQSTSILGAKTLVIFALGRDSNGIVLQNDPQNPGSKDSTTIQSSLDTIPQVNVGQAVQATLRLTSNSSKITGVLTVSLNLQGSGVVSSKSISIGPGSTQPAIFNFTAPTSPGLYTLTIFSPQYAGGQPLTTQTLQVVILQSYLQFLIPAIIGLVIAIAVLGYYLMKRQPQTEIEEKTKPTGQKQKPKSQPGTATAPRNP